MKNKLSLFIFISLFNAKSFSQHLDRSDFILSQCLPDWITNVEGEIKTEVNLEINKKLNPFYLESDFNNDGQLDIAIAVTQTALKKSGVLIIHGKTFDKFLIGAGNYFGNSGDNFDWMGIWKIYRKPVVYETIFADDGDILDSKEIPIDNIAIEVAPSEGSTNLIIWSENKYRWIHSGE